MIQMISINAIIFSNYMICRFHLRRHEYPPDIWRISAIRIAGSGGLSRGVGNNARHSETALITPTRLETQVSGSGLRTEHADSAGAAFICGESAGAGTGGPRVLFSSQYSRLDSLKAFLNY